VVDLVAARPRLSNDVGSRLPSTNHTRGTALALLLVASNAEVAGFDCTRAQSPLEKRICDDPDLNSLDSQLAEAFAGALDRVKDKAALRQGQRTFLAGREGKDLKALRAAYQARIDVLQRAENVPDACTGGGTTPDINACAAEYSRRAEARLARYCQAARARLKEEAASSAVSAEALKGLEASQAAFVAYRRAECDAVYRWWSEGTIRGLEFESCFLAVTEARTLTVWNNWLQFKDSTPPLLPKPAKAPGG
jgi:uncharacterized protein